MEFIRAGFQHLGSRTFAVFVIQRMEPAIMLFALSALCYFGQNFVLDTYIPILSLATSITLLLGLIAFGVAFIVAWIVYINYKFSMSENALLIERGVFHKEEVSIPYRQIQNVNIARLLPDRILGVGRLIILTAGEDDSGGEKDAKSHGVLPVLERHLAETMRNELVRRSNIQNVVHVEKEEK